MIRNRYFECDIVWFIFYMHLNTLLCRCRFILMSEFVSIFRNYFNSKFVIPLSPHQPTHYKLYLVVHTITESSSHSYGVEWFVNLLFFWIHALSRSVYYSKCIYYNFTFMNSLRKSWYYKCSVICPSHNITL